MNKPNKANPHTVKKFELVEGYVKTWAQTLLNAKPHGDFLCRELVFIDCMCNNGIYEDDNGNIVEGTPIRVAKIIADIMPNHQNQKATLYFNDSESEKIAELQERLPPQTNNFQIRSSVGDGNELLKKLGEKLLHKEGVHYLLFYDPYKAAIDWKALAPYFFGWGEVILNHMVSDPVRALKSAKSPEAIDKYQKTYLMTIDDLVKFRGDKKTYDELIKNIIHRLRTLSNRDKYYLAVFPFFIKTNVQIYSIIFFTNNIEGFKKFKSVAWKTFGGKSSNQNTREDRQLYLPFAMPPEDKQCYFVSDIADYIIDNFKGRNTVPFAEIYKLLDEHPIFPTNDYKTKIKDALKLTRRCTVHVSTVDFV
ncbi:MAG: three-Cys-motif partner protein TcmP [Selenomonadaceae bacterium]|nr:three-Cys-motif partner protein TcmP [Selenomonadaceae bacterium]